MTNRIKKRLQKIIMRRNSSLNQNKRDNIQIVSLTPETIEERRREAMEYLLRKYLETKKRQEELEKKLQSYGTVRRWLYRRGRTLRYIGMFFKEIIVKPVVLSAAVCSAAFSIWLGTTLEPLIAGFTETHIIHPFNYVVDLLVLFPIGFSPTIISILLSYFQEKRKLKRLLENYSIIV